MACVAVPWEEQGRGVKGLMEMQPLTSLPPEYAYRHQYLEGVGANPRWRYFRVGLSGCEVVRAYAHCRNPRHFIFVSPGGPLRYVSRSQTRGC